MQICKELPGNQHLLVLHFGKADNSLRGTIPAEEVQFITWAFISTQTTLMRKWQQLTTDWLTLHWGGAYSPRLIISTDLQSNTLYSILWKVVSNCIECLMRVRLETKPVCLPAEVNASLPTSCHKPSHRQTLFSSAAITNDIYGPEPKTLQTVNLCLQHPVKYTYLHLQTAFIYVNCFVYILTYG